MAKVNLPKKSKNVKTPEDALGETVEERSNAPDAGGSLRGDMGDGLRAELAANLALSDAKAAKKAKKRAAFKTKAQPPESSAPESS